MIKNFVCSLFSGNVLGRKILSRVKKLYDDRISRCCNVILEKRVSERAEKEGYDL